MNIKKSLNKMFEKIPATTSSKTTPNAPGSFSIFFSGQGLKISKNLNNKNATKYMLQILGNPSNATDIPMTSSITMNDGSLPPRRNNTFSVDNSPKTKIKSPTFYSLSFLAWVMDPLLAPAGIVDRSPP